MAEFTKYVTKQGDRLDTIAHKMFGNPHLWDNIINENPNLPLLDEYEGGIEIAIPVISAQDAGIGQNINLPPWKR